MDGGSAAPVSTSNPTNNTQSGWISSEGSWSYVWQNNRLTGWQRLTWNGSQSWYYFDSSGIMQKGWLRDGGNWYYLMPAGTMRTGWLSDNGRWYYLQNSGAMVTGWHSISGVWYWFDNSGTMATGTRTIDGRIYRFSMSGAWIE